jgi:hypothetical protein
MSNTVWVIEDGAYSDYRVVGVFSSRENAELILGQLESGEIAEWPLDPAVDKVNAGLSKFCVHMLRDGTIRQSGPTEFAAAEAEYLNIHPNGHPSTKGLRLYIFAEDEKHAIKIANEKRAMFIANGAWPDAAPI